MAYGAGHRVLNRGPGAFAPYSVKRRGVVSSWTGNNHVRPERRSAGLGHQHGPADGGLALVPLRFLKGAVHLSEWIGVRDDAVVGHLALLFH